MIARSQLRSMESLAGTLLHERAHSSSGRSDVDRGFELELTDYIGLLATEQLKRQEAFSVTYETSILRVLQKGGMPQTSSDDCLEESE